MTQKDNKNKKNDKNNTNMNAIGPGNETRDMILNDFENWRISGFKPWGNNVGSAAHWRSRKMYQVMTQNAFRSQAKRIAKIAREQMPAEDIQND